METIKNPETNIEAGRAKIPVERFVKCGWTRVFDGNFNIGCVGETGKRANGQFKGKEFGAKWEFVYCPYCGRKIEVRT